MRCEYSSAFEFACYVTNAARCLSDCRGRMTEAFEKLAVKIVSFLKECWLGATARNIVLISLVLVSFRSEIILFATKNLVVGGIISKMLTWMCKSVDMISSVDVKFIRSDVEFIMISMYSLINVPTMIWVSPVGKTLGRIIYFVVQMNEFQSV